MRARLRRSTIAVPALTLAAALASWTHTPVAGQQVGLLLGGPIKPVGGCPGDSPTFRKCGLEKAKSYTPPRTPQGEPDFQGHWNATGANTAGQSIVDTPGDNGLFFRATPGIIADPPGGQVPYTAAALARYKDRRANEANPRGVDDIDPNIRCVGYGVPRAMYGFGGIQILQASPYIVILNEWGHQYRVVPMDGRPPLPERIKLYMADSRGRWEGNTLVISSSNLNPILWLDSMGNFTSANTKVVERLTLVDADTMLYEATLTDPALYTQPWTIAVPLARNTQKGYEMLEYACHEGEKNFENRLPAGVKKNP